MAYDPANELRLARENARREAGLREFAQRMDARQVKQEKEAAASRQRIHKMVMADLEVKRSRPHAWPKFARSSRDKTEIQGYHERIDVGGAPGGALDGLWRLFAIGASILVGYEVFVTASDSNWQPPLLVLAATAIASYVSYQVLNSDVLKALVFRILKLAFWLTVVGGLLWLFTRG